MAKTDMTDIKNSDKNSIGNNKGGDSSRNSRHTNKENKIKRLRKAHIWPSVLFLILSVVGSVIGFIVFVAMMLFNQTSERFDYACTNAVNTISSIDAAAGREESLVSSLRENASASDALFVMDASGNMIAGYGEPTYLDSMLNILGKDFFDDFLVSSKLDGRYSFSVDSGYRLNLLEKNGNLNLLLVFNSENSNALFLDNADPNEVLFDARFWIKAELSEGRTAIVKCIVPLYRRDFHKSLFTGISALLIMLFPIFFFFINVIVSIHGQRHITKLLYTDTVTGGNSFVYFENNAGKALNKKSGSGRLLLVADITIMKYRGYCTYHGVRAGEALLEDVDREIVSYLGKGEICAHSGAASYALLLKCTDRQQGQERIDTIIHKISEKLAEGCIAFHAGIYFHEPDKNAAKESYYPADCFNRATAARASITDDNVTAIAVYDDKLLEAQLWEHKVEEKMQAALDNEEFKVYLQPKYNPLTRKLSGAEALIRWINDEDGFIPPGRFIPIFEKNGFITKIDDYMLSHVAKLQSEWLAEEKTVVPVSVNVSRAHFASHDLADHICAIVDEYKVPHNLIEIELTESAFFDDKEALLRTVNRLRELDFEISMDDFGAGYSSLNSLKDLPLDVLKLDAEFFRGEDAENRGEIVVSQAIQLAKSLNMRIVAEGVEKKEQVDFLAGQGCDMIQGFYFAKPMPAEEYAQRL